MVSGSLLSMIVAACFVGCGVLFLRARLRTRDRFFGTLAITFLLLAVAQFGSAIDPAGEGTGYVFLIRLIAFVLLATKMVQMGFAR